MKTLYEMSLFRRIAILWIAFMAVLWVTFGIGLWTHPDAYAQVPVSTRETGWRVLAYILVNNGLLLSLIVAGNLFVRFGHVTPGLVVLAYQAVAVGWIAGTNGFSEPFPSVAAANSAFLRIGLWETTAYVLLCAITLDKSLNVAATFPAREWTSTRKFEDIRFSRAELAVALLGVLSLLAAAWVEAF